MFADVKTSLQQAYESCLKYLKMKSSTLDMICRFLGELIGTGLLVLLGCMGCIGGVGGIENSHFQSSFNFGLVILVVIQCFGCVSGSHFNPAVTVAAFVYKMVSLQIAALYVVAQMLGGFIGYGLLKAMVPGNAIKASDDATGLCVTMPHADISGGQAVAIEFVLTGVLILVCCGVWDPRNAKFHDSVPIRFGLAVACLALTGGPYTGASMNPARSFAPALWNNDFRNHWVYWIGPMAAGFIISFAYKTVFRREAPVEKPINKLRAMEEVPLS